MVQQASNLPPLWKWLRDTKASPRKILDAFGVTLPAVDIEAIARGMGIVVEFVSTNDYAGLVEADDFRAVIRVRANDLPRRKRFTIAHEIGHLFLHPLGVEYRDQNYAVPAPPSEQVANQFAADLLMPSWMLTRARSVVGGDVVQLANTFDVTPTAMQYRLKKLGMDQG
jgi:Zn-dependent peptidase ImmA (M78 family)